MIAQLGRARRVAALAATLGAAAAGGCATSSRRPVPPPAPAAVAPRAEGPASPPPFRCGPRDDAYEAWLRELFGTDHEAYIDGPDPARLRGLTVGALTFDVAKTNVVVLSSGPRGVAVRLHSKRPLSFARQGRPPPGEPEIFAAQREVGAAVREMIDHSLDLPALITASP